MSEWKSLAKLWRDYGEPNTVLHVIQDTGAKSIFGEKTTAVNGKTHRIILYSHPDHGTYFGTFCQEEVCFKLDPDFPVKKKPTRLKNGVKGPCIIYGSDGKSKKLTSEETATFRDGMWYIKKIEKSEEELVDHWPGVYRDALDDPCISAKLLSCEEDWKSPHFKLIRIAKEYPPVKLPRKK